MLRRKILSFFVSLFAYISIISATMFLLIKVVETAIPTNWLEIIPLLLVIVIAGYIVASIDRVSGFSYALIIPPLLVVFALVFSAIFNNGLPALKDVLMNSFGLLILLLIPTSVGIFFAKKLNYYLEE